MEVAKKEITTSNGIVVQRDDRLEQADVIDVGPEAEYFKKGDVVYFEDWAVIEIQDNEGTEHYFVSEDHVVAYGV